MEIAALVVRFATENQTLGYLRIQGALANLGHKLARNTIANILKRYGRMTAVHIYQARNILRVESHECAYENATN